MPFLGIRTWDVAGDAGCDHPRDVFAAALLLLAETSATFAPETENRTGFLGVTATVIRPLQISSVTLQRGGGIMKIENAEGADVQARGAMPKFSSDGSGTIHWARTPRSEVTVTY